MSVVHGKLPKAAVQQMKTRGASASSPSDSGIWCWQNPHHCGCGREGDFRRQPTLLRMWNFIGDAPS